jgi:murein DD-endopeptidase MepM/ murein hydrolase activator NlpD
VYVVDEAKSLIIKRDGNQFLSSIVEREYEHRTNFKMGVIDSSLFLAAQDVGLSVNLTMELANIFGWDIDFALDIREGDKFTVIYDELFLDGEKVRDGDILAAEFINNKTAYRAVRYVDGEGRVGYYTPDGHNMRKAFLRTPVDFTRISSRFGYRHHPVLNRMRIHKGVDYAAPRSTPIKSTGDGKIVFKGNKGGYGKTLIIQHGSGYQTLYAHMNGFRRGLKVGSYVRQGQIIGYVGSSGLATGPHLHYEFRINGVHRNPLTIKFPDAEPIKSKYKSDFTVDTAGMLALLDILSNTAVALTQ